MFKKNDRVAINDAGQWLFGTVIEVASDGECKVRWDKGKSGLMWYPAAGLVPQDEVLFTDEEIFGKDGG